MPVIQSSLNYQNHFDADPKAVKLISYCCSKNTGQIYNGINMSIDYQELLQSKKGGAIFICATGHWQTSIIRHSAEAYKFNYMLAIPALAIVERPVSAYLHQSRTKF
ncbi:hypothetical protein AAE02nite_30840 [Adhaeribacter aerolatus]|uniref:Uncharacterized protein n=1 Tax=Adhaeribacter aerolatus TaxID=670289 RepID=A0A512B0C7_9BACT|nr:hypothetical protein [Adhaeribacter aerolatus]GEO05420.1 hypothetical protein AAE02nite_30840 [Adhaeribacter aerolatus]